MRKFYLFYLMTHLSAQGSVMLVGGNAESYGGWSDDPYGWFVQQADSGKIVNIDVSEASDWYPAYFINLGADSSSHELQIPNIFSANSQNVYHDLVTANGIFIEGGDQWDYVQTWKGTLVDSAIHVVFNNGGIIGGTSAGLAILGEIVFDAENGSLTSDQAIANPYHPRISFTDDFLDILSGVLTDSHFNDRGRLGRLVTMVARRAQDHGEDILGLGMGIKTAFCIDQDRIGTVYGKMITVIHQTDDTELYCVPAEPLRFTHLKFHQLLHGAVYDIDNRVLVDPGENMSYYEMPYEYLNNYSDLTINGSNQSSENYGEIIVTGITGDSDNWWYGGLGTTVGDTSVPDAVIIPKMWTDYYYFPNRIIGGLYGIVSDPPKFAFYLDDNCSVSINENGLMTVSNYAHILDAFPDGYAGYLNGVLPGISDATLHYFTESDTFDLSTYYIVESIDDEFINSNYFAIQSLYPNPFNPQTTLHFSLMKQGIVKVNVFNIRGESIDEVVNEFHRPGEYSITWSGENVSTGIYYFKMKFENEMKVVKGVLIK